MRLIIVEDEPLIAQRLERLIREILGDKLESLYLAGTFEAASARLAETPIDLLLLDLNLRGEDIPRVPVAHGFAILHKDARVTFFTRASPEPEVELDEGVTLALPEDFASALKGLTGKVRLDRHSAPVAIADLLTGAEVVWDRDPCVLPKAKKTKAEIAATTAAHDRDAIAMVEFLAWLAAPGSEPDAAALIGAVV